MNDDIAVTPRFPERADEPLIEAVRKARQAKGTRWEWWRWFVANLIARGAPKD